MKFQRKSKQLKIEEKIRKYGVWHRRYAWLPQKVVTDDGIETYVWFGFYGRRGYVYEAQGEFYHHYTDVGMWDYCLIDELVINTLKDNTIRTLSKREFNFEDISL